MLVLPTYFHCYAHSFFANTIPPINTATHINNKITSFFDTFDVAEAHRALLSTLKKCEKIDTDKLPKAQRTLLKRRIAALKIALDLINDRVYKTILLQCSSRYLICKAIPCTNIKNRKEETERKKQDEVKSYYNKR